MTEVHWAADGSDAAVADRIAKVVAPGGAHLGVPGGRTPVAILGALAQRSDLPWRDTRVTLTDERIVAPDHPASNQRLLRESLGASGAQLRPLAQGPAPGRFDLVWLGMGADGHVASIFPSTPEALTLEPAVIRTRPDPLPADAPFERLTLTLGALIDCAAMILVVRGADKRAVIEQALGGSSMLPIGRLLLAYRGPLTIYWQP